MPRQCPVFGIHGNSALKMRNRRGMFTPLSMGDGEHVQGVIVIGILVSHQMEMRNRLVVLSPIDGDRRCIEAFVDRLGRRIRPNDLALTNVEVEPNPFVQFLFFGVLPQNALE
jgi:hypothetical protein